MAVVTSHATTAIVIFILRKRRHDVILCTISVDVITEMGMRRASASHVAIVTAVTTLIIIKPHMSFVVHFYRVSSSAIVFDAFDEVDNCHADCDEDTNAREDENSNKKELVSWVAQKMLVLCKKRNIQKRSMKERH